MYNLPSVINGLRSKYNFLILILQSSEISKDSDVINYFDDLSFENILIEQDSFETSQDIKKRHSKERFYSFSLELVSSIRDFNESFQNLYKLKFSTKDYIEGKVSETTQWKAIMESAQILKENLEDYFEQLGIKYGERW